MRPNFRHGKCIYLEVSKSPSNFVFNVKGRHARAGSGPDRLGSGRVNSYTDKIHGNKRFYFIYHASKITIKRVKGGFSQFRINNANIFSKTQKVDFFTKTMSRPHPLPTKSEHPLNLFRTRFRTFPTLLKNFLSLKIFRLWTREKFWVLRKVNTSDNS